MHLYMDNSARHCGDPQGRREHGLDVDESNQERGWMEAWGWPLLAIMNDRRRR